MWIIIIIIAVIVIGYLTLSYNNQETQNANLANGGLKKSYPVIVNHLQAFYGMGFVSDTGRSFTYSKEIFDVNNNKGVLCIGVKLGIKQEPLIFSKFTSVYKQEFNGIDVIVSDFENVDIINNAINISIEKIKSARIIEYSNAKTGIAPIANKEFIEEWISFRKKLEGSDEIEVITVLVNEFFIPDLINLIKYQENYSVLVNSWMGMAGTYGTSSIKEITVLPRLFNKLFVAAYPDVYLWFQKNSNLGKVHIWNELKKLNDIEVEPYLRDFDKIIHIYKSIVHQYKAEGNVLECEENNTGNID